MDFVRSLWRRWILWRFFRSYDGAIKYTRRKRCKELEKRFPPWYTQTFSEQVRTAPFIFTVRLLCHSFAVWVFFDSDLFSQPVLLCVAFALFVEMILFRGLERWWWQRKHPDHPYAKEGAREAARARADVTDTDLHNQAFRNLIAFYGDEMTLGKEPVYRDSTHVRVDAAIECACEKIKPLYDSENASYHVTYKELLAVLEAQRAAAPRS